MREIKFRAWDNNDYMSKSFTLQDIQAGHIELTGGDIVMQYTGLKDSKNGKEIYEGDILRITDTVRPVPNIYIHVVSNKLGWCTDGEGGYTGTSKDYAVFGWDLALPYEGHHEIIGNIYENPELLTC